MPLSAFHYFFHASASFVFVKLRDAFLLLHFLGFQLSSPAASSFSARCFFSAFRRRRWLFATLSAFAAADYFQLSLLTAFSASFA